MSERLMAVDLTPSAYDIIHSDERGNPAVIEVDDESWARYHGTNAHRYHLEFPAYQDYVKINKVLVGQSGAEYVIGLGKSLENENLPILLDAAGWALAEGALAGSELPEYDRLELIGRAEDSWHRAIMAHDSLSEACPDSRLVQDDTPFRVAMNIACSPLMRSIIQGDVTPEVKAVVRRDLLNIAEMVAIQSNLAFRERQSDACGQLSGVIYECCALLAILNIDQSLEEPRYVPLPSSARADSGYYYGHQTHDISLISQHWGEVRKVIPLEVKRTPSGKDYARYKSVIIGKSDLMLRPYDKISKTLHAFSRLDLGTATVDDMALLDHITSSVKKKIVEYKRQPKVDSLKFHSKTKFHEPVPRKAAKTRKYVAA